MTKALILDRDGVVNTEKGYVHKIGDIEFVAGIFEVCRYFQAREYRIFVVTNQAGIARGFYTTQELEALHAWMGAQFAQQGIELTKFYYCPHHPEHGSEDYRQVCACRKPEPGMILQARDEYGLDLSRSILIGDNESDIQAGLNAGVALPVLLRSEGGEGVDTQAQLVIRTLPELLAHEKRLPA